MSSKLFSRSSQTPSSPSRAAFARALRASLVSLSALVVVLSAATSVRAAPVDVFFNGNRPANDPTTAFGISLASAIDARDNFGVPIVDTADLLTTIRNRVSVIQPSSSSLVVSPNPPTAPQNTAISNWKVKNVSRGTLEGASYLVFTHTDPYAVGRKTIEYADDNVGLRIDAAQGWVIVKGQSQGVDYYYPALLLGNDLEARQRATAAIHYVVDEALIGIRKSGRTKFYLPELQLGFARLVVPEPGTALLFGLGLTLLASQRKRA
jgi:hypothetical protein